MNMNRNQHFGKKNAAANQQKASKAYLVLKQVTYERVANLSPGAMATCMTTIFLPRRTQQPYYCSDVVPFKLSRGRFFNGHSDVYWQKIILMLGGGAGGWSASVRL